MTKELSEKRDYVPLTKTRQKKFLELLELNGSINRSAAELGATPAAIRKLASKDFYFKEAVEIAKAKYLGALEDAAFKRAVDGVEEDVYFQGQKVGTQTKYSDKLLETLLKANDPNKYSTKVQNQTNNTLIVDSGESTVAALSKFLGVEDNKKESVSEDDEDIIEGEYEQSDNEE